MNKNTIIGIALIAATAVLVCAVRSSVGEYAARFFGKAVWYLPYASLVAGIGRLRA